MLPSPNSPILLEIGSFQLRYYSLILLIAILAAQWFALHRRKKFNIQEDHIYDISLYAVIFGLIGARIFHVIYEYQYYFSHLSEIPKVWEGGLAIHGGIVFGIAAIYVYCRYYKLSFLHILDLFTPSLLIGQAIGRWGNYFNQEAFGTPTSMPWGIFIQENKRPIEYISHNFFHPTFLYESLWNIMTLFLLLYIEKKQKLKPSNLALFYLLFYSVGRSMIEFIRLDATFLFGIRFIHILSIFFTIIALFVLMQSHKHSK